MEIGPISVAGREIALNKKNVENDIAQRILEKLKEMQEKQASDPVGQINRDRQGLIDIFA